MCYIVTDKEKSQAAKSYLSKIATTDALITQLQGLVHELRGQLNGQNYTLNPDKVQTSGPKDNMTAIIDKIVDFEADINRNIDKLVDQKRETAELIEKVPDQTQRALLIGRYVRQTGWGVLAVELKYSIQHLYRIHGKALLAFFDCLPQVESK